MSVWMTKKMSMNFMKEKEFFWKNADANVWG